MRYIQFSDEEKIMMFDKIADEFYNSNFGSLSKSEMELMMFDFYIKKMMSDCRSDDDTFDYSLCSDYKISKDLGITQQRVRNLKVKNQLVNPIEFDWKLSFAKLIKNAVFDGNKVIISIPDPNLYYEIQNFIEEQGAYIEKTLNSKHLVIRTAYFVDLILSVEPERNKNEIVKMIKKDYKEQCKDDKPFDDKNIGKSLISGAVNVTAVLANISSLISPNNEIFKMLTGLITP